MGGSLGEGGERLMAQVHSLLCEIDQLSRDRALADNRAALIAKLHQAHFILRVAGNKVSFARDDLAQTRSSCALKVMRLWPLTSTRRRLERLARFLKGI